MTRSAHYELRRRRWLSRHARVLTWLGRGRPVPLAYWRAAERVFAWLFGHGDVLVPPEPSPTSAATAAAIGSWGFDLEDLGGWALEPETVVLLARLLEHRRPTAILEFGAGASTLFLARHSAARCAQGQAVCVTSIEQDADVAATIARRLQDAGLDRIARVIHAPLDSQGSYTLDLRQLDAALGKLAIDFVLVDGPFGPPGCRLSTLPAVLPRCSVGALWVLDDALRDGELAALRAWRSLPALHVEGIVPMGRGVALGTVVAGWAPSIPDRRP